MRNVREHAVGHLMHPLSRILLQNWSQIIQGLRGVQEVLLPNGLTFERVSAIVPGRLALHPLRQPAQSFERLSAGFLSPLNLLQARNIVARRIVAGSHGR